MVIGNVLGEAWALYTRFFGRFFLTALLVFVVLDLLSGVAGYAAGGGIAAGLFWALVAATVSVVGYFWVQTTLVETVNDVRDGRADRSIGETFKSVRPQLPTAIGAGLLAAIGIGIGLLLLIVPGLFLLTIWSMLIPVIVLERRKVGEAFTRSREIVRGNGWNVFGLVVVTVLVVSVASGVIRLIFSPLPAFLEAWLGSLVVHSLTIPFVAATLTTAYFHLVGSETAPETESAQVA
jgi:hypothetical protein